VKDHLREIVRQAPATEARNLAREYVQALILASLQRTGAMIPLAFLGGTALRFLYAIRRHSEDLDFSLERPGRGYGFSRYLDAIRSDLAAMAFTVDVARVRIGRAVHSAFLRFPGLLHELGLSGHRDEALAVRIEVDSRPPAGARLETTVVRRHELLNLQHHDRASLLAGQLHAVLLRPYPKGRDFHDLIWYLSDRTWPAPNLELLGNALRQTGWTKPLPTESSWRGLVRRRARSIQWNTLVADVLPLLENPADAAVLTRANLDRLLGYSTGSS
jgi:hypothetical protein